MGKKVFIVDDSNDIQEVIGILLTTNGHSVKGATNSGLALDLIRYFVPDLLLMDLKMPGMDSCEFVQSVRQFCPTASIVLMSGAENLTATAATLGIEHWLRKPFENDDLLAMVKKTISKIS